MTAHQKRKAIKAYFITPKVIYPVGVSIVGVLLVAVGMIEVGAVTALSGVALFVALFGSGGADEKQIDKWFQEDMSELKGKAMQRVRLDADDVKDALMILGPLYWKRPGVPKEDYHWKKGRDNIARFTVYRVTIVFVTEHYLNWYQCDFNFIKNSVLNEQDSQYNFRDLVSVGRGEMAQSETLVTGENMPSAEGFWLTFTNGQKLSAFVAADVLKDETKAELPPSGVEGAVMAISAMLRPTL